MFVPRRRSQNLGALFRAARLGMDQVTDGRNLTQPGLGRLPVSGLRRGRFRDRLVGRVRRPAQAEGGNWYFQVHEPSDFADPPAYAGPLGRYRRGPTFLTANLLHATYARRRARTTTSCKVTSPPPGLSMIRVSSSAVMIAQVLESRRSVMLAAVALASAGG
jgi:hypothetical protein